MKVNGQYISLDKPQSIFDFLTTQNYEISQVAVELNGRIVPKSEYKETMLKDEDTVEVVRFVGGG